MKRIVFHIVTHFGLGGAEKVAFSIAASTNPQIEYHLVEVVRGCGPFSARFVQEMEQRNIRYHRSFVRNNKWGIALFPLRFLYMSLRYRPDVIHSHTEIPDLSVYLFHRIGGWLFNGTKYVRTIHNTVLWREWEWIGRMVESFFISSHSNVAISPAVQKVYFRQNGEEPPIIYNGVEETRQVEFKGTANGKINVLFAGRLEGQKGIDELLAVIQGCKDSSDLEFWIVGVGSRERDVISCANNNSHVHYHKEIYGLSAFLASFDYLFMPSVFEGLALLSVEASYSRVPTIINNCPGLQDTLPETWPLKVSNNNVDDYLTIFRNIRTVNREELGQIAYDFVKERFPIKKMREQYECLYLN